jgi:hypothetical protein
MDLPTQSKHKVIAVCDVCGNEKEVRFMNYIKNINNSGYYACSGQCSLEKIKRTNIKRYGYAYQNQSPEDKERLRKQTTENWKNSEYVEKIKNTNQEKYGNDWSLSNSEIREKGYDSMIDKYGVKHSQQSEKIKKKTEQTNIEKYGETTPLKNEKIKNKIKNTKIEKYGDENYNNRKQYHETCKERFGVANPSQNEDIRAKQRKTMVENYGVEYPAQNPEIYKKTLENSLKTETYRDTELTYQSSYEKDFLDRYYDKIPGITQDISIPYKLNECTHIYYPDFYIKRYNLIIEIKSDRWFKYDKEKCLAKEKECQRRGYKYIMIMNKDYSKFNKLINELKN